MLIKRNENTYRCSLCRPILRWAGSKYRLLNILLAYWNNSFNRYIEPFAGSARLFFAIQPEIAILGDLNEELILTYTIIRDYPEEVYDHLINLPKGKEQYYTLRSIKPGSLSNIQRAARFLFLNRYCYNGLYRTNLNGDYNVPYSPYKTGHFPNHDSFLNISNILKKAMLITGDFENTINFAVKDDFIYLDPPYAVTNKRAFIEFGKHCFAIHDLERLSKALKRLSTIGVSFVVSYAECPEAYLYLNDWNTRIVSTQRTIANSVPKRSIVSELVISNLPIPQLS